MYQTSKLYLAAALMSAGAGLKSIDRTNPKRMEFMLSYTSPLAEESEWFRNKIMEWDSQKLYVNAQNFVTNIQTLISEVHK